jgi:hypothetical protein
MVVEKGLSFPIEDLTRVEVTCKHCQTSVSVLLGPETVFPNHCPLQGCGKELLLDSTEIGPCWRKFFELATAAGLRFRMKEPQ